MDIHGPDFRGKDGRFAKAGSALLRHYYYAQLQGPQIPENQFAPAAGQVTIDAVASEPTEALRDDLEALGATNIEAAGPVVSARISIQRIPEVALLSSLHQVRMARPQTHEPPVRMPPQRDASQEHRR